MNKYKFPLYFVTVLMGLAFLSSAFAAEPRFKDVLVSHWAYSAIDNLAEAQIVKGYPDNTFKPDSPVTREQFAAVLTLSLGFPIDKRAPQNFSDVERSDWAFYYIDSAKSFIPTPGNPKGYFNFNGQKPITREEVAVALEVYNKALAGYPDGAFNNKGLLTRAELCVLMDKLLNEIEAQKPKKNTQPEKFRPVIKEHKPWTLEFKFERPDYDLVKCFTGIVALKVYGLTDNYLVLDNYSILNTGGDLYSITKTVNMYVYEDDMPWFNEGDMLKVNYDRKNNIISYEYEREAKSHPYEPVAGGGW